MCGGEGGERKREKGKAVRERERERKLGQAEEVDVGWCLCLVVCKSKIVYWACNLTRHAVLLHCMLVNI